jgi:hypothetical protein
MIVAVIIKLNCTDLKIDVLVYELYGLTEEEIKIVEEGGGRSGLWPRIIIPATKLTTGAYECAPKKTLRIKNFLKG